MSEGRVDLSPVLDELKREYADDRKLIAAGLLLIAALDVGPHIKPLKWATGVPWAMVQNTSWYLRRAGVWKRWSMHYPWMEPYIAGDPAGEIGFVLDAMVGAGYLNRALSQEEPVYALRHLGDGIIDDDTAPTMSDWWAMHDRSINVEKWPWSLRNPA